MVKNNTVQMKCSTSQLIFVILLLFSMSSCGIKSLKQSIEQRLTTETELKIYTKEEIQKDIDFFFKTMEEVCPYPYLNTDSVAVHKLANEIKQQGSLTGRAFYFEFSRLIAAFRTGHIYSMPPLQMMESYFEEGGKVLPLGIAKTNGQWQVDFVMDTTLNDLKGKIVQEINGMPVQDLIDSFEPYFYSEADVKTNIGYELSSFLWLKGIEAPFELTINNQDSNENSTIQLEGANMVNRIQNNGNADDSEQLSDFITFEMRPNNIAYINAKSFAIYKKRTTKQFSAFVEETFAEVKAKKVENLIIDLRENAGGKGQFAEQLLQHIAQKPYRQSAGETRRVSQQFKDFIGEMPGLLRKIALKQGGIPNYMEIPVGANRVSKEEASLGKTENRFEGKVWCLIGPGTYSAGMMMANAIEDYDLGTLVGEPTGGIPNELSDVLPVKTPNAKISFMAPSVIFTRANGDASNPNPVLPNVEIIPTKADIEQGKDPVMDYVLQQIN